MATHSSILAWEIPWTEEPGGLQSVGSQRIRHNWATEQSRESLIEFQTIFLTFPWITSASFGALTGSGRGSSHWPGGLLFGLYSSSVTDAVMSRTDKILLSGISQAPAWGWPTVSGISAVLTLTGWGHHRRGTQLGHPCNTRAEPWSLVRG